MARRTDLASTLKAQLAELLPPLEAEVAARGIELWPAPHVVVVRPGFALVEDRRRKPRPVVPQPANPGELLDQLMAKLGQARVLGGPCHRGDRRDVEHAVREWVEALIAAAETALEPRRCVVAQRRYAPQN
jgi:hypothetical protein